MDKKAKKKIEVLRQRLHKFHQQLAGATKQNDEPGEVQRLQDEIAATEAAITKLKTS